MKFFGFLCDSSWIFLEISVNYMDFSMIFFLFFNVSLKCKEMESANVFFLKFPNGILLIFMDSFVIFGKFLKFISEINWDTNLGGG